MTHLRDLPPFPLLQFYATAPYGCSYLPGRVARSQVSTPTHLIDPATYSELVKIGFRRSGVFTYRPWCDSCRECLPVRVPAADFEPNRSQRRALARHGHLVARERPLSFREEHYALYQHYQFARHAGGGMDKDNREQYAHFLLQTHVDSRLIEFHASDKLCMVFIIDLLDDGLSSVYTFYDTDEYGASFGTYAILWQIAQCQRLGLPHLYLGYWIESSRKMAYKAQFRPLEALRDGHWTLLED
ncbi:MAG: arginyltransferase [Rhodocyclaceae bacterium]|nr:arginyltransferase [Rhodocyclaceae bacterium]